jgi:crotonobetainyl-CoA:carnitine CoA-transferase CaiB-like acyl-CoA transferase
MSNGAFEKVRIIELGHFAAMPTATAILADWGADVIKIENPKGGDPQRGLTIVQNIRITDVNMWFEQMNRNKRSIALDVTKEHGKEILHKLVQGADVFATNYQVPLLERIGADYDTLSKSNPRLVYALFTGYGTAGPDRYKPGYDYVAFWARSGMMDRAVAAPGRDPLPLRPAVGDSTASLVVAGAIGASLFARERTGIGQKVELNLYQIAVWALSWDIEAALHTGVEIRQFDRRITSNPMVNYYKTKDGKWIIFCMPYTDMYWDSFCKATGRPDLAEDSRFDSHTKRVQENLTLIPLLSEIAATKTADEWEKIGQEYGLVLGKVYSPLEVVNDPQAWENDFFAEVDHPVSGQVKLLASPMKFSKTPASVRSCAPELGQHTEEVLLEIGYTWDDMVEFKNQGVIL